MNINKEAVENNSLFKFLKKYWIPILAVIVTIAVIISTIGIYKEEVLHIDPSVEYENGDKLYLASSALDTLNPIISNSSDTYYISKLIYSSLFDYTDQFNVVPELVEKYTTDTEKARIDITLKSGIKWHDGTEFTAKDVSFTVNAIKSYGSKGVYYDKASKIYSVQVKDNRNLTIYFRNNHDCSLDDLVFPILPSGQYSSISSLIRNSDGFSPVGTGQYKFQSYNYLKELELSPNESYFGDKASMGIHVEILPDKKLASNMMEIHAVTCYADDSSERYSLAADKNFTICDMTSNDVEFIVFNQSKDLFKEKKVRQAAAYSIDTENILEKGYMNDGVLTDNIYYPGFLGVPDTLSYYQKDADKAKELLKEAGYEDRDLNVKIEDNEGKNVEITILVNSNNAMRNAAAKIIANDLENVGFSVNLNSLKWEDYVKNIERRDFDILVTGYDMEASYDLREFFNGKNLWKYTNNDMLKQASELERLHDASDYNSIYTELKNMMMDELPYYTLCYKKMGLIGVEYFEAGKISNFENIYKNCNTWTWKKVKES